MNKKMKRYELDKKLISYLFYFQVFDQPLLLNQDKSL